MTDGEYTKYTAEYLIAHNGDCDNMDYPENENAICRLCSVNNVCFRAKENADRKTAAEVWLIIIGKSKGTI